MAILITVILIAGWCAAIFWQLRKYRNTGDRQSLKNVGALLGVAALFAALILDYTAVIFEERADWPYLLFLAGAVLNGIMSFVAAEPGKKISSVMGPVVFFFFGMFLITMMPAHGMDRALRNGHAERECEKAVPGSARDEISRLDKAGRQELAARLGEALSSEKRFVPLGALYKLHSYLPEEAPAAMPGIIALIESGRGDEHEIPELRRLLRAMGPAAAAAAPALEARIARKGERYESNAGDFEGMLYLVRPEPASSSPATP